MDQTGFEPNTSTRRWWRSRWVGAGAIVLLLAALAALVMVTIPDYRVRHALAEADRLDPAWRFEDLEGRRASVPDEENAALVVLAARAQMPAIWFAPPPTTPPPWAYERLAELPPPHRPTPEDLAILRQELAQVAAAATTARRLADMPRGRYTVAWAPDLVSTMVPHLQQAREVARMLAYDALLLSLDGRMDEAVRSCQAAVNTGRSIGDEPCEISQMVRVACVRLALRALEQVLGQGEASPAALRELQALLEKESSEPWLLTSARAERVQYHAFMEILRRGRFNRAAFGMRNSALGAATDNIIDAALAAGSEADYLHYHNQIVEVAKTPPAGQWQRMNAVPLPTAKLPKILESLSRGLGIHWPDLSRTFHGTSATLRCAVAALAAERYRQAEGRWPERLDDLVPRYLDRVPADPFDDRPLRLKRTADGMVIYSIGPDEVDDGGAVDWSKPNAKTGDVGVRLWDLPHRKQPPLKADRSAPPSQ